MCYSKDGILLTEAYNSYEEMVQEFEFDASAYMDAFSLWEEEEEDDDDVEVEYIVTVTYKIKDKRKEIH